MQDEIFGPVLPGRDRRRPATLPSSSSTTRPKPLALYVFSSDDETVTTITDRTSSGGVCVNH